MLLGGRYRTSDHPVDPPGGIAWLNDELARVEFHQLGMPQQTFPEGFGHFQLPDSLADDMFCLFLRHVRHAFFVIVPLAPE